MALLGKSDNIQMSGPSIPKTKPTMLDQEQTANPQSEATDQERGHNCPMRPRSVLPQAASMRLSGSFSHCQRRPALRSW